MFIEKALSYPLRCCTFNTKEASSSKLCEARFQISFCACEVLCNFRLRIYNARETTGKS